MLDACLEYNLNFDAEAEVEVLVEVCISNFNQSEINCKLQHFFSKRKYSILKNNVDISNQ